MSAYGERHLRWKLIALGTTTSLTLTLLLFVSLLASGAIVTTTSVSSSGVISTANLGIYSDSACTQKLTSISWGNLSPGNSVSKTVYVKNTGNTALTLRMTTTSWNPTAANGPIRLSWNRENTVLAANQVTTATLTLTTQSSISGITTFSMNIVVSGNA
jgi:hypothetical protein